MTGILQHTKHDGSADGLQVYSDLEKGLKAAGLLMIAYYVGIWRATVLKYVSTRPIDELCMEASQKHDTGKKTYWFEQEMDLEEDKVSPTTVTADGGLDFQ